MIDEVEKILEESKPMLDFSALFSWIDRAITKGEVDGWTPSIPWKDTDDAF